MKRLGCNFAPPRVVDPIEAVRPQPVIFRNVRIREVFVGVVHADALHDSARLQVEHGRERYDLGERKCLEADAQGGARPLGGVASAPMGMSQTPANLDTGRERQDAPGHRQPDEADERTRRQQLDGPVAPAAPFERACQASMPASLASRD